MARIQYNKLESWQLTPNGGKNSVQLKPAMVTQKAIQVPSESAVLQEEVLKSHDALMHGWILRAFFKYIKKINSFKQSLMNWRQKCKEES